MSIRDLSDSPPYLRHPPQPPATADAARPPFGSETPDPWAEPLAEHRPAEGWRAEDHPAEDTRGYRVRSEEVWQAARAEYAAGFSAEAVCAQFDLGLSAFRQRARREGWRRSDVEAEPPEPLGFAPEPEAAAATPELVDLAWRSAAQAIRRGRAYEARAWMRLWNELKAVARDEQAAIHLTEIRAAREAREAAAAALNEEEDEDELHPLHREDGVQSDAAEGAECETPPAPSADARAVAEALNDVQSLLATATRGRPP